MASSQQTWKARKGTTGALAVRQHSKPAAEVDRFLSERWPSFQSTGDEGAVPQTWGEMQRPAHEISSQSMETLSYPPEVLEIT